MKKITELNPKMRTKKITANSDKHTLFAEPPSIAQPDDFAFEVVQQIGTSPARARIANLSSIAAEQILLSAQAKIKTHYNLSAFVSLKLVDYWPKGIPVAPFIDNLTFGQLADMSVKNLLDKRSFSEQKVRAVVESVEAVCSAFTSNSAALNVPKVARQDSSQITTSIMPTRANFLDFQAYEMLIRSVESELLQHWWGQILLEQIGVSGTADLLTCQRLGIEVYAQYADNSRKEVEKKIKQLNSKLAKGLKRGNPGAVCNWLKLLNTSAAPLVLFKPISDSTQESQIIEALLIVCLVSLGGREFKLFDYFNPRYFTSNFVLLSEIQKRLTKLAKTRKRAILENECRLLLPLLSKNEVIILVARILNGRF